MLLIGLLFMVAVGAAWTVFGYAMGQAPKKNVNVGILLFLFNCAMVLVSLVIGWSVGFPQVQAIWIRRVFSILFISGIANYLQLEWMSKAMQGGPNGIIWSIVQAGFIFPFLMGIFCFHVPCPPLRVFGMAAILVALYLMQSNQGTSNIQAGSSWKWKLYAFGAFLMTGVQQCTSNFPSYFKEAEAISSVWRTMMVSLGMAVLALFFILKKGMCWQKLRYECTRGQVWSFVGILVVMSVGEGYFLLYTGMNMLAQAKAGAIAYPLMVCSSMIVFELYSLLFLHEKRTHSQRVGLILCILGSFCLACGGR